MTISHPGAGHHHNLRFYIVLITLVVGGIFIVYLLNTSENVDLTAAVIGLDQEPEKATGTEESAIVVSQEGTSNPILGDFLNKKSSDINKDTPTIREEGVVTTKQMDFELLFDQIPEISNINQVDVLELEFADISTNINVNNDKLGLNDLQEVTLRIEKFSGKTHFSDNGLSIDGTAKRIEVNGVSLASIDDLNISFDSLDYDVLKVNEVDLDFLELAPGKGSLNLVDRFDYSATNDAITIYKASGEMIVDREEQQFYLNGVVGAVSVQSDAINYVVN